MNLKNKRPVFVPLEFQAEIEQLSKATLMDMIWDYARQCSGHPDDRPDAAMDEFRERRAIIQEYRK